MSALAIVTEGLAFVNELMSLRGGSREVKRQIRPLVTYTLLHEALDQYFKYMLQVKGQTEKL